MALFPGIRSAWREWQQGQGDDVITLGLNEKGIGFSTASDVNWLARNGYPGIAEAMGGTGPSWSGESVTQYSALNHSVVWACNRIISESVAFLPLHLMRAVGGERLPASNSPVYRLLHDEPNAEQSDMEFRETLTHHCVQRGNGYAQILRKSGSGQAMELVQLLPDQVRPDKDKQGRLVYIVKDGNGRERTFTVERRKPQDILHLRGLGYDGVQGYGVVTIARQSIGSANSAEKYAGRFYATGGRVPYVLEMEQRFKTEQDFQRFRTDWNTIYSNPDAFHVAPILENGLKYKSIGLSPEDAQFLETRQFNVPELCRWYLISPHLVGDLSRATFSNIEHLALEFVKRTLTAWIVRWEKAIYRCLLTEAEKEAGYYAKHNLNGLLRGDFQSRMAGYATILQNGVGNIDEVRELEDWNPLPNGAGKAHHIQLNMQTLPLN